MNHKRKLAVLLGFLSLALSAQEANASLVWNWSFPESNVTLNPTETFYIGGTIINDPTSTEDVIVDAFSLSIIGGDLNPSDFFGGLYTVTSTVNDVGGLFYNMQPAVVSPGSSYTFTIYDFTPISPIALGTASSWSLTLFHDDFHSSGITITDTMSFTVSENTTHDVSSPSSAWLALWLPIVVLAKGSLGLFSPGAYDKRLKSVRFAHCDAAMRRALG